MGMLEGGGRMHSTRSSAAYSRGVQQSQYSSAMKTRARPKQFTKSGARARSKIRCIQAERLGLETSVQKRFLSVVESLVQQPFENRARGCRCMKRIQEKASTACHERCSSAKRHPKKQSGMCLGTVSVGRAYENNMNTR